MSKQTINIGASPNDGTGTPLRTSFDYTNQNFTEIYTALGGGVALPGATTQVIFNDGGTNLAGDAGLVYNKTTDALTVAGLVTAASATITGAATVGTTLGVTGVSTFAAGTALLPALTTTGDTNTGIYYPAADTFAVTTGGVERYRVDSTGNVGVAVTPSAWGGIKAFQIGQSSSFAGNISLPITYVGSNFYFNGTNNIYIANGFASRFIANGFSGGLSLEVAASGIAGALVNGTGTFTQAMVLDASGNLTVANGNVILGTSGKGIDFTAAGNAAGMTSELLNDYEEGTFTPTVIGATIAGVGTYTQQAGYYTKVGNLVTASVFLGWTAHTGTGLMYFGGLPFTSSSGVNSYGAASIAYVNNISLTASNVMNILVPPAQSYLEAYQTPVGGGAATSLPIDVAGSIIYTVTYRV